MGKRTVGQNSQEYRLKYWATRSSVRSLTYFAHSPARGTVSDWMAILSTGVFFIFSTIEDG